MPNIGELDDRITVQKRTESVDNSGGRTFTWADSFTTWAKVREIKGNEKYEAARLTDKADIEILIRYRGTFNRENYRVVYNSDNYDIYSVTKIGRNEWERVFAQKVTA